MLPTVIAALETLLGAENLQTGAALQQRYAHIWRMHLPLQALAVVTPRSTEEVSAILKICQVHRQTVVIHGGLTGLVGSTQSGETDLVLSLEKMNAIEEIDTTSRSMTVQAGVILEHIHEAAAANGLMFPMSFGAKGSAQIGGVIATNAGGLRVFRYGMTRNLVLGLEAVLANGTIISSLKKIIKDNSGYDLKQLFIGSEGTLGVLTRAVLKLEEAPTSRVSALVGLNSYDNVTALLRFLDAGLAGTLSSFELMWAETYACLTGPNAAVKPPLPYGHRYYVLLDALGSNQAQDEARLTRLMGQALEQGLVEDAVFAQSEADLKWFWTIREDVGVLRMRLSNDLHFDISMPVNAIGPLVEDIMVKLHQLGEVDPVYAFGHVADGNIHLVMGRKHAGESLKAAINEIVYAPLKAHGGSISAEHGIGLIKKPYLHHCRTESEIALMKLLKQTLDPQNILNPGRILEV